MTNIIAIILLIAFIIAQLAISKSFYQLKRNFWLDEILTYEMATTPKIKTTVRAIISGLDTNPPAFHLLLRVFRKLILKRGELTLRCIAFVNLLLGIIGIYFSILMAYPWRIALLTALIIFIHPQIRLECFNARMYSLWFTSTVWFAFLLMSSWNQPPSLLLIILLAFASLLVCMLHTLGLIALLLTTFAQVVFHGLDYSSWPVYLAACIGPIVFSFWIPIFFKQKDAYSVAWSAPTSLKTIVLFLRQLFFPRYLMLIFLVTALSCLFMDFPPQNPFTKISSNASLLAGLASLALFAWVLILISLVTSEPILVARYGLPTVAGISPVIAAMLALIPISGYLVIFFLVFFIGANKFHKQTAGKKDYAQNTAELISAIRKNACGKPIFFESAHELFVTRRYASDLAGQCFAIDFQRDDLGYIDGERLTSRDTIRIFSKHFNGPDRISWSTIRNDSKFFFVPSQKTLRQGFSNEWIRYPGFLAFRVEASLYCLEAYIRVRKIN